MDLDGNNTENEKDDMSDDEKDVSRMDVDAAENTVASSNDTEDNLNGYTGGGNGSNSRVINCAVTNVNIFLKRNNGRRHLGKDLDTKEPEKGRTPSLETNVQGKIILRRRKPRLLKHMPKDS